MLPVLDQATLPPPVVAGGNNVFICLPTGIPYRTMRRPWAGLSFKNDTI